MYYPIDFIVFSVELLAVLCGFTNVYFEKSSHLKSSYSASWVSITVEAFCNCIVLYVHCYRSK